MSNPILGGSLVDPDSEAGRVLAQLRIREQQEEHEARVSHAEAVAAKAARRASGDYGVLLAEHASFAEALAGALQELEDAYRAVALASGKALADPASNDPGSASAAAALAAVCAKLDAFAGEETLPQYFYQRGMLVLGVDAEELLNTVRSGSWEAPRFAMKMRERIAAARQEQRGVHRKLEEELQVHDGVKAITIVRYVGGFEADRLDLRAPSLMRLFRIVRSAPDHIRWDDMPSRWVNEPGFKGKVLKAETLRTYGLRLSHIMKDAGFGKYWSYSADAVSWRAPST